MESMMAVIIATKNEMIVLTDNDSENPKQPGYGKKIHGAEEMTYVFESVRAKNSLFFGSSESKEDAVRMAHIIQPNMVAVNIENVLWAAEYVMWKPFARDQLGKDIR